MRVCRSGRKPPKWASNDSAEGGGIEDSPLMRVGEGRVGIEKAGMVGRRVWSAMRGGLEI
jgi:hypothetical protein